MLLSKNFHTSYCTNIHPGENWEVTFHNLKQYIPQIKESVSKNAPFGIGLRLSDKASRELNENNNLAMFKNWLDTNELYVFTMNGFPYGNFHDERVKDFVHAPDWTTSERVTYTKRLFDQLSYLIPPSISGGISTSPLSYKHWHKTPAALQKAREQGAQNITEIILQLYDLENQTGTYLHLDIEPEPDGVIENSEELIAFFEKDLVPIASKILKENYGLSITAAKEKVYKYCTICYDVCHFALAFEQPAYTFKKLENAGISVGKIQVSSALKIMYNDVHKEDLWQSLAAFDEATYLHQVTEKTGNTVKTHRDLPTFIKKRKEFSEIRVHFHVPIFLEKFDRLYSTQDTIIQVLDYIRKNAITEHLEIETYTWEVLPTALKTELSACIIREINWLKDKLIS